ncbi:Superfamily II DNA or RNA helicase [Halobacillus alkaliphilus]|uniref:Superfamily II DNA or RNA helicase n=1 Tax=Halobacillus alkaliphilus TaxID=396056 RepID=A0A1I2L5S9_9BACI|nr:DEAD/DEAH box helicase family protein [Halobacillus alkaliphilus]SFF72611.1 Superfamily II DNA or RNA helicase [Halobacillus alkaliphilus]
MSSIRLEYITQWDNVELINRSLKSFQIEALNTAIKYINSRSDKHALIKLPTGTGKTLIIYMLANFYKKVKNTLIVTSSDTVKKHILYELEEGISNNFELSDIIQKKVIEIFPKDIPDKLEANEQNIYVTTIQALSYMKSNEELEKVEKLKECVDLVLFDEGHKEPASKWKKALRELDKKVILFTATPIRDDKNKLRIDNKHIYNFPLANAMEQNYIRTPNFIDIEQDDLEPFIDEIIEKCDEIESNEKVIIRFKSKEDIIRAHNYLKNSHEKEVISIHEEFTETNYPDDSMIKKVPKNLRSQKYTYWLHQYKLIEGMDDSSFKILALFDGFSNARPLVQQVGRILRQSEFGGETKEYSTIIFKSSSKTNQEELWKNYLIFEEYLSSDKSLISFDFNNYLNAVINSQPKAVYIDGKVLPRIELNTNLTQENNQYLTKLKLPFQANVLIQKIGLEKTFEEVHSYILNYLEDNDLYLIEIIPDHSRSLILCLFAYYSDSPYLADQFFIEPKTGLLLTKLSDNYIFIYNSFNHIPHFFYEFSNPLNSNVLEKVYDEGSEFKQISIQNGNISKTEVKRSTFNAEDMNLIAPSVTDRYKFATTANGKILISDNEYRNRYVGFKNGRITDSTTFFTVSEYLEWLASLESKFERVVDGRNIFERYAPVTEKPEDVTPRQILLDIDENLSLRNEDEDEITLNSKILMIEDDNFILKADNGDEISYKIVFNDDKDKYYISAIGQSNFYLIDNTSLSKFLSNTQSFHIITNSPNYIYSHNFFIKVGLDKEKQSLRKILKEFQIKERITHITEKGYTEKRKVEEGIQSQISEEYRDNWDENSLFYLLTSQGETLDQENSEESRRVVNILNDLDYLICEDLEYEIADFIGIKDSDGERKVYFIHAKAEKEKKGIAASAFQDVCSQIIKNLDYVHPLSEERPNFSKWERTWKQSRYKVERQRITTLNNNHHLSPAELWALIKDIQQDQEGEVYVWALLSNMLSLRKFESVTLGHQDDEGIIPLIYILSNTWSQVQNAGAKFEILFNKIEVQ